jgi:branched-chain amino acid transport system permease protein
LVEALISGLLLGSSLALLAIGYTLVFGVMHLLTIAHGEIFMASGLFALVLASAGTPVWLAGLYAIAIGAVLSYATDVVCFRPVGYQHPIAAAVSTIGLAIAIGAATIQIRGSSTPVAIPFSVPDIDFRVGGVLISAAQVLSLVIALAVMLVTHQFVKRSRWGMAMRAFAHDPDAVTLLGIPTRRLTATTLIIAGALAGLASYLLILRDGSMSPTAGLHFGLVGLAIMTIGGIGSLPGAMIAGLVLGALQSITAYIGFTGWQAAVPWLLLILTLLVRPQGLLGTARVS